MNTQTKDTYCINCGGRYINNICPQCGRQNISAINAESQNNNFVSSQQTQASGLNYNNQIPNNNLEHNLSNTSSEQSQSDNTNATQTQDALPNTAVKLKVTNTIAIICVILAAALTIVTVFLYSSLPYLEEESTYVNDLYTKYHQDYEILSKKVKENNKKIADLNKKIANNQATLTELNKKIADNQASAPKLDKDTLEKIEYLKKDIESCEKTLDKLRTDDMYYYENFIYFIVASDTKYCHKIYCHKIAGQKPMDIIYAPLLWETNFTKCPYCIKE